MFVTMLKNVVISSQIILPGLVNLMLSDLALFHNVLHWKLAYTSTKPFKSFLSDLFYLSVCSVITIDCIEWLVLKLLVVGNYLYDGNFSPVIHVDVVLFCGLQKYLKFRLSFLYHLDAFWT